MMPISHLLEDFAEDDAAVAPARPMSDEDLEDHRLAAFEKGYSAGWEDAIAAHTENRTRVSEALARSLEDLSFTYHEVRTQVLDLVEPVFESLVSAVLPDTMMRVFGYRIVEQLNALTADQIAQPVVITVSSAESTGLKQIVADGFALPVEVQEDGDLDPGMAIIRVGSREYELDSSELIASIAQAVTSFFQNSKDSDNG